MRKTIYQGKSYEEADYEVQKAVAASGMYLFRYYLRDRLMIAAEITAEKFSCGRFYPNMPQSFADDMVCDEDKSLLYEMYRAIENGGKKSTAVFHLKNAAAVRVVLSLIDTDENTDMPVAVGMMEDVTEEIAREKESRDKERQVQEQQVIFKTINRALSSNYNNVYLVDLASGNVDAYNISREIKKEYGDTFRKGDYSTFIQLYVQKSVYEPDRELFDPIIDIGSLGKSMRQKSSVTFNYRVFRDERVQYFKCRAVRAEIENKDCCVIAFRDINDEVIRDLKQKTLLEKQEIQLKNALAKSEQYKNAVLAEAIIFYEANLSKNVLEHELWEMIDGVKTELLAAVGMTAPADYSVFQGLWAQHKVKPECRKVYEDNTSREYLMKRFEEGHMETTFEFRAVMGIGREAYMRQTTTVARDEHTGDIIAYCNVKDITEQKLKEQEMHRYEQMFIATASDIYASILRLELDTRKASRLMRKNGCIDTQDVGDWERYVKYQLTYVHPDDAAAVGEFLSIETFEGLPLNEKKICSYRSAAKNEAGNFRVYSMNIFVTEADGRRCGIIVTIDNTEAVERELRQQRQIEDALARAEAASRAKTTFLSNMSHDIRTPMNAIIGFTTLATTHIDNTQQVKDYLAKIMSAGNNLLSLINAILDMSRIESGRIQLDEVECSLSEIMQGLSNILQADMKAKRLNFYIDTVDVYDENVVCDKLRLNQILLNLLGNAVKFTEPGGSISVRIYQKPAESKEYARYEFHVRDTGIGMGEEFQKHLFEPFERESTSTVSGIQGTGLGMSITKNVVEMMGGTISVQSKRGTGSEFTVELPMKKLSAENVELKVDALEGAHALVVDDDFNTCDSVSNMLIQVGMRAEWTMSGKEAILRTKQAISRNDEYRVYVIDWMVPDMNGIEIARQIRKEVGESVPIIILTAYDWSDIEEEGREAGVTEFCSKPIFFSDLRRCLVDILYPGNEEKKPVPAMRSGLAGKRVLLVEDNDLNREIASEILSEAGFIIEEAEDGSIALEKLLKKGDGYYSLVLMDIQMPVMDGYAAARAIRSFENRSLAEIPIIAMTANAFEEDKRLAFEAGMNAHIAKPINVKKLFETLEKML